MKNFSQFLIEAKENAVFTFGRLNPPTVGHLKLLDKVAQVAKSGQYFIYVSQSQDSKKNPLSYKEKIKFIRKMFPKHSRNIISDKNVKTPFHILDSLYDKGFKRITMVVGSDRVKDFKQLLQKYNGVKRKDGFYEFESIEVISAGERDPDSDSVAGMSASKMRAAAAANDFQQFSSGLPKNFKEGIDLFNAVRTGMGLKESYNFREHIEFKPISKIRELYINGRLFEEKDSIIIKKTGEHAIINKMCSNYIIDTKNNRHWLTDVEKV